MPRWMDFRDGLSETLVLTGTSGTVLSASWNIPPWANFISIWDYYTSVGGAAGLDVDMNFQLAPTDTAAQYIAPVSVTGFSFSGALRSGYTTKATWGLAVHNMFIGAPWARLSYALNAGNNGTTVTGTIYYYYSSSGG